MAKKSKNTISINWDEEEGGKFLKNPGEYIVKATSVEQDDDDEGKLFLKWTFEVVEGKQKGATISTRTYVTPKALWKLRELLECMGIEVPQGSVQDLDLDEVIEEGEKFVIEVEEGNERSDGNGYYMQVSDFMSLEDYDETSASTNKDEDEEDGEEDAEAEEEEPVSKSSKKAEKGSKKKGKSKEVDEDELLDQMEEEIDELGLDLDLDDYDTFEEKKEAFEEAKAAASKKSKKKAKKEEEEEDEEEEAQHYTSEEIEALGTKQLKVIAAEIGLELDDEASTRSKRRSVIAGLRKAGLLDED